MNQEIMWIENDLKVEQLALKLKFLREEYTKKNPFASKEQIENYINKKLKKQSEEILKEQFGIISKCELFEK